MLQNWILFITEENEKNLKENYNTSFSQSNVVSLFIFYKLDTWPRNLNTDFTHGNCLFGAAWLTKNANPDKYGYSGYGIGFDAR